MRSAPQDTCAQHSLNHLRLHSLTTPSAIIDVYEVLIGADGVRQSTMFKGRNGIPFVRVEDPIGPDAEGPRDIQINPPASGPLTPEMDPFQRLCAPW